MAGCRDQGGVGWLDEVKWEGFSGVGEAGQASIVDGIHLRPGNQFLSCTCNLGRMVLRVWC